MLLRKLLICALEVFWQPNLDFMDLRKIIFMIFDPIGFTSFDSSGYPSEPKMGLGYLWPTAFTL